MMSESPDAELEERLREHYRRLRVQSLTPQTRQTRRRRPSMLAAAASVAIILAAGGAYLGLRNTDRGQPLQTGPGAAVQDDIGEPADPSSAPTTETQAPPTSVVGRSTTTPEAEEASGDRDAALASGSRPDSESGSDPGPDSSSDSGSTANADGSPRAPQPGTVAPPGDAEPAMAYGVWQPGSHDTCSKETHDSYWVYGPDGKIYPTYHPPVDPASGCTFGHEHGRDPSGSDLADIPFPFGYVNELAMAAGLSDRHEDHVGHKIEWYNDGGYYQSGNSNNNHDLICDVAYKLHMGTHSDDAFANNAHEVFHYARCENGSELIYRALHQFGNEGEFNLHCNQQKGPTVTVDTALERSDRSVGGREIPASQCFEDRVLVPEGQRSDWFSLDERWTLYQSVDSADFGRFFIQFYFFADAPSRYWDGEKLARTVDLCYLTGALQVRNDEFCEPMRAANPDRQIQWDDPASPFNGADRRVFMIDLRLDNNANQSDWYTDINGGVWSAEPFPGSIRQRVGTTPIDAAASYRPDPIRSITFAGDIGIHAPN